MKSNRLCDKDVSLLSKLKEENKQLKEKISKLQKIVDRVNENRPAKVKENYSTASKNNPPKQNIINIMPVEVIQNHAEALYYAEMNPVE